MIVFKKSYQYFFYEFPIEFSWTSKVWCLEKQVSTLEVSNKTFNIFCTLYTNSIFACNSIPVLLFVCKTKKQISHFESTLKDDWWKFFHKETYWLLNPFACFYELHPIFEFRSLDLAIDQEENGKNKLDLYLFALSKKLNVSLV